MTINPNNTTAACRSVSVSQYLDGYEFRGDGGDYTPDANEKELIEDAIEGYLSTLQDQASAPRSASADGDQAHYLSAIRRRLEQLYDASPNNPRLREQLSDELDWVDVQIEEGKLSAPPTIRIDQDVGIRERLIAVGCTSPDGSYIHASTESVLAAISANTTAGATSLGISEDTAQLALDVHARRASPKVGPVGSDDDIRFLALSMAGEAGEAANVVKKAWRDGTPLNRPALAEEIAGTACYLIGISAAIKLNLNAEMREQMAQFELRYASNPLEGKGIQSITEQASSGLRSTKQREG